MTRSNAFLDRITDDPAVLWILILIIVLGLGLLALHAAKGGHSGPHF